MIYLDTALLVRLYVEDPGFELVRRLAASDHVACAAHGQAEALAAFHRKLREGALTPRAFQAVLAQFDADQSAGAFHWLTCGPEVLARVRQAYASLPRTIYLRGADALHLASAAANGFVAIHSNDTHLLTAAPIFKLKAINPLAA